MIIWEKKGYEKLIRTFEVLAIIVLFTAAPGLPKPLVKDEMLIPKMPQRAPHLSRIL